MCETWLFALRMAFSPLFANVLALPLRAKERLSARKEGKLLSEEGETGNAIASG